ncbi:MAG: efflux RND transporter periplasmic adaptor subunit [Phototrophicaceae bacterium]
MRRTLHVSLILIALLMVAQGVLAQQPNGVPVNTVEILDEYTVEPTSLSVSVNATGTLQPIRTVDLAFELISPVEEIYVQEGESVTEGDPLAKLAIEELEASLREAELALELQQLAFQALTDPPRDVDVAVAEASVAAAEAGIPAARRGPTQQQIAIAELQASLASNRLYQAQLQRDIVFDLNPEFRGGADRVYGVQSAVTQAEIGAQIATQNIDVTRTSGYGSGGAIASAEAQLIRAQVALEQLLRGPDEVEILKFQIQLEQAQTSVEQARIAVNRALLTAPFDGVIADSNLIVGELPPLGANSPALRLVDTSAYYVDIGIDESDVVNVQLGQPVALRLDALPEATVTGSISRLALVPSSNQGVVIYRARVTLDPTLEPIRIGMSATATITTNELQDILVLPNRFIRIDRESQTAFVTIERDGRFVEIPVTLGERNNDFSQITSGLDVGQRVIQLPGDTFGLADLIGGPPGN